jgi:PAS domain S-box-containing protein
MYLNIYAIPVFLVVLITVAFVFALQKYRSTPGVKWLILSQTAGIVYSFFYVLEISSTQIDLVWIFYQLEYLGIPFIPAFFLFFAMNYSGEKERLTLPIKMLLLAIPAVTMLMVYTNTYHHWFLTEKNLSDNGFFIALRFKPGIWYWVHQGYAIFSFLISFLYLLRIWIGAAPIFKKHTGIILLGSFIPFLVYISYLLNLFPWGLDPVPFSVVAMAIACYYGVSMHNLFNLAPLARNLIFDKLPDAILVFDHQNRIIDCNDPARQLFGIRRTEIGRNAVDILSDHPIILDSLTATEPDTNFDYVLTAKNQEIVMYCTMLPLYSKPKSNPGRILILHDITKRRKAEKERFESEEKFRLIVENAPLGVIYFDKEGIIRICNDEFVRIIGSSRDKLIGLDMKKLPDERVVEILKRALSGENASLEGYYKSITAVKTTPVKVQFEGITSDTGEVTGGIGIVDDITERIEAQEKIKAKNVELERLNVEKDRFFSIIAHDLRSPFNAFLGFTELMTDENFELSIEEMKSYAHDIRKSALLLFDLLENLLEWSRMQRLVTADEKFNYPLIRIVIQSVESLQENADKKEISIHIEFDENLTVNVAEKMIQSVFRNLISNAIKFTYRGGKVTIKAKETDDDMVEVTVTDTGVGINPKDVQKLFRIDQTHSTAGTEGEPSTGLGLILCREFIEKHGGKIWVESQVGMGSTFSFTLPKNGG